MREAVVPAPDIAALVARERRFSILAVLSVLVVAVAAAGLGWMALGLIESADRRAAAAEAIADAARADAEAARLVADTAETELQGGRVRFAQGVDVVNEAKGELLRTRSTLASVKDALTKSRNLALLRTGERDAARAEIVRLEEKLGAAGERIASLGGEVVAARLRVAGGMGYGAIATRWNETLRMEVAYAEVRLQESEAVVARLLDHIGLTVALSRHVLSVTADDARMLAGNSDRLGSLLERVLDMQSRNTRFSSANKPDVGFNSPGFAGYVLGRVTRGKAVKSLPETDTPQLGDIIRYQNGFDMFLLEDAEGERFVIGMTPIGIAALSPDFGVPRASAFATGILPQ